MTGKANHLAHCIDAIGSAEHLTWQNSEIHRDSAFEDRSVTYWHYAHNKDGVPHYNIRGGDAESAAVEAAGVLHEFLEIIVVECACLLSLICRACHVSVIVNRGRLARYHLLDDSQIFEGIHYLCSRC